MDNRSREIGRRVAYWRARRKLERHDLAWLAADRAMLTATASGDTVCLARATRSVARAMTETNHRRAAIEVLTRMAQRMEPELMHGDPSRVSMYGMLLLPAAIVAARDGDADTALVMHRRAEEVAAQLGSSYRDELTAFGVSNVALHRLPAPVRLHDRGRAIEFARTIDGAAVGLACHAKGK